MQENSAGVSIGTIRFFVNDPKDDFLSDEEKAEIARQVIHAYEARLEGDERTRNVVRVESFSCESGCLIVSVNIALVAGLAWAFLKDYKKVKEGVVEVAEDMKGLVVKLERWARPFSVFFYNDDMVEYAPDGTITFKR